MRAYGWENKQINLNSFILVLILFSCLLFGTAFARHYPQKSYTVDDGLPQSNVKLIMEDSYGFL